jgi:hypothetical protein
MVKDDWGEMAQVNAPVYPNDLLCRPFIYTSDTPGAAYSIDFHSNVIMFIH